MLSMLFEGSAWILHFSGGRTEEGPSRLPMERDGGVLPPPERVRASHVTDRVAVLRTIVEGRGRSKASATWFP
jgi:hypothetical protein